MDSLENRLERIGQLKLSFHNFVFTLVYRELNEEDDYILKWVLGEEEGVFFYEETQNTSMISHGTIQFMANCIFLR